MRLHLNLKHRKTKAEDFVDILDVSCAEVCALIKDFGKNGLVEFIDRQVEGLPATLDGFEISSWKFV